jgi:transcriptional regulator of aromatic amino acid metabolism
MTEPRLENIKWFEAKNLEQAFQILFKNHIDVILTTTGRLPDPFENFLRKSNLTPLIADISDPLSQIMGQLENQKLAQKNVSMNEQFELLIQYGEWNLLEKFNDLEPILMVCPPGAETEAAALAVHLKSNQNQNPFEIYRFENQSEDQIEKDLWGYFWQEENPYINRGLLNKNGTLLLIETNRMPAAIQQKLTTQLKNIQKRMVAASPIPLSSLSQNNLFSKELAQYFSRQTLTLPALEDRLFDLPAIADQTLARINKKYHLQVSPLSTETIQILTSMHFENGYKELEAVLTLAALKKQKGILTAEDLKVL